MVVGTCRVYRSAFKMERDNVLVARVPHRVHTLRFTELALRYHQGEDVIPLDMTHTLSRRAGEILVRDDRPFDVIEALRQGLPPIGSFDAYIIEISALKEHFATPDGGREVRVNSLVEHDLMRLSSQLERLYARGDLRRLSDFRTVVTPASDVKGEMRRIKNLLGGKPILWVPQANVPAPGTAEQSLFTVRARLSKLLEAGGEEHGRCVL
ncbi:MAG: hypothetical protein ACRED4_04645 [Brevundimonas sp.]